MTNLIFANNTDMKKCSCCVYSTKMITDGDFLCRKGNGIVRADFKCRKFDINVLRLQTNKRRHLHNLENLRLEIQ